MWRSTILRDARADRGQSSVVIVGAVAVIAAAVFALIPALGGGVQKEQRTRTAADAAALAAAESYRDAAADLFPSSIVGNDLRLAALKQAGRTSATALVGGARSEAARLASANDARLSSLRISPLPGGIRFTATTRANETTGSHRAESTSTAQISLGDGPLCFAGSAGALGIRINGACVSLVDFEPGDLPDEPGSEPTPSPSTTTTAPEPTTSATEPPDLEGTSLVKVLDRLFGGQLPWNVRLTD